MDRYDTIHALVYHHKYSLTELENLYPFELDIYAQKIMQTIQEMSEQRSTNIPLTKGELQDYGLEKYMNKNVR
jgi:hypothetical protein